MWLQSLRLICQDFAPKLLVFGDMGRYGGAPSLEALIKETKSGQYTAALHVGDFAYDLFSDGGQVRTDILVLTQKIQSRISKMSDIRWSVLVGEL